MTYLPAAEALFLGAPTAHAALYDERRRIARIEAQNRAALARHQGRTR